MKKMALWCGVKKCGFHYTRKVPVLWLNNSRKYVFKLGHEDIKSATVEINLDGIKRNAKIWTPLTPTPANGKPCKDWYFTSTESCFSFHEQVHGFHEHPKECRHQKVMQQKCYGGAGFLLLWEDIQILIYYNNTFMLGKLFFILMQFLNILFLCVLIYS